MHLFPRMDARLDFILMTQTSCREREASKLFKMKNPFPQWNSNPDSNPQPSDYEVNFLSTYTLPATTCWESMLLYLY